MKSGAELHGLPPAEVVALHDSWKQDAETFRENTYGEVPFGPGRIMAQCETCHSSLTLVTSHRRRRSLAGAKMVVGGKGVIVGVPR